MRVVATPIDTRYEITVSAREAVIIRTILRSIRGAPAGPRGFIQALEAELAVHAVGAKDLPGVLNLPDTDTDFDALPDIRP